MTLATSIGAIDAVKGAGFAFSGDLPRVTREGMVGKGGGESSTLVIVIVEVSSCRCSCCCFLVDLVDVAAGESLGGADDAPEAFLPLVPRFGVVVTVDGSGGFSAMTSSVLHSTTLSASSFLRRLDRGEAGIRGDGGRRGGLEEAGGGVFSSGFEGSTMGVSLFVSTSLATSSFAANSMASLLALVADLTLGDRPRSCRAAGGGEDGGGVLSTAHGMEK